MPLTIDRTKAFNNQHLTVRQLDEAEFVLIENTPPPLKGRLSNGNLDNAIDPKLTVIRELFISHGKGMELSRFLEERVDDEMAKGNNLIFVPIILKARKFNPLGEDHIVLITFNLKDRVVEYYDPKGGAHNKEMRYLKGTNVKGRSIQLSKVAKEIIEHLSPTSDYLSAEKDWTIVSNKTAHQKFSDKINCGVFVWKMIDLRGSGQTFDQANASISTAIKTTGAIQGWRSEIQKKQPHYQ